jgi:hypothetical protein
MADYGLLFSQRDQQVHRLNATSAVMANMLGAGATSTELADELGDRGVAPATAASWVDAFLDRLSDLALLEAEVPGAQCQGVLSEHLRVAGIDLAIDYGSDELLHLIGPSFANLKVDPKPANLRYRLASVPGWVLIDKGEARACVFKAATAAVRLKGFILDHVIRSELHLAAFHAACLRRDEGAVMLLGSPGAGKTTLSLALLSRGYDYGSDDVTLLTREGLMWGASLAPAVKESGWELAGAMGTDLSGLETHLRPDGQRVRFPLVPKSKLASASAVRAIVQLRRTAGEDARLNRIAPEQALGALLRESLSPGGECSTEIMRNLANIVRHANCFELTYSDARDAAGVIAGNDCA